MNIIRTKAVELQTIPAIAYKQKLASGGAGLKITRLDAEASAVMTIDKRTGEALPFGRYDESLFPDEAIDEAMEMTMGLPYSARGKIRLVILDDDEKDPEDVAEEDEEKLPGMTESDEYKAIVERYMDEKGKMNYQLMNKDFIQFAAKSKTVADLAANKADTDAILNFIIKNRAAFISGKKDNLEDRMAAALIETLEELDPRSAFKELKQHIRRMLSKMRNK